MTDFWANLSLVILLAWLLFLPLVLFFLGDRAFTRRRKREGEDDDN